MNKHSSGIWPRKQYRSAPHLSVISLDPTPRRNISKFNGHFSNSVLKYMWLRLMKGVLKDIQKFLLHHGLAVWRELLGEYLESRFSWSIQIPVLACRQQMWMETKWQEQERTGTDFKWGTSETPGEFEVFCRWEANYCANLYVCAIVISFVPQTSRSGAI